MISDYLPYISLALLIFAIWWVSRRSKKRRLALIEAAPDPNEAFRDAVKRVTPEQLDYIAKARRIADAGLAAAVATMLKEFNMPGETEHTPQEYEEASKAIGLGLSYALSDALIVDADVRKTSVNEMHQKVLQTLLLTSSQGVIITDRGRSAANMADLFAQIDGGKLRAWEASNVLAATSLLPVAENEPLPAENSKTS